MVGWCFAPPHHIWVLIGSNTSGDENPEIDFTIRIAEIKKCKLPTEYLCDIYLSLNSLNELHL
jgi:hypothetical protein